MKRSLYLTLPLAALVWIAAGAALAQQKSVAVLGLEVKDSGGGMSMGTVRLANALTDGLRKQASLGNGPYRLAPNTKKGLAEMKLLAGCDDDGPKCLARIGSALGAEILLFGKLERTGSGAKVSLQLIDVKRARKIKGVTDSIPEAEWDNLDRWARTLYAKLVGLPVDGSLTIQSNASTGTVYVDGSASGQIAGGTATLDTLPEGRHRIAVESPGYRRWDGEVSIKAGQSSRVNVELRAVSSTAGPEIGTEEPGGGYRVAFWTALGIGAAVGAFQAVNWFVLRPSAADDVDAAGQALGDNDVMILQNAAGNLFEPDANNNNVLVTDNLCAALDKAGNDSSFQNIAELQDACDKGKRTATFSYVAIGVGAAAGAAAAFFFYKGYVSSGDSSGERSSVRVSPQIGPNAAAVGVSIDF